MVVTYVDFKHGVILPRPDGKNCLNCAHNHEGLKPKVVCLACTRFGHDKGQRDNWKPKEA